MLSISYLRFIQKNQCDDLKDFFFLLQTNAPIEDNNGNGSQTAADCVGNTPCGWAIYTPFTRVVTYFMQNT